MSEQTTEKTLSNKSSFWGFMNSMKARMFIAFTLLLALSLTANHLIEYYGIPFTPYVGRRLTEKINAFNSLNLTADLKKESLENSITEFKNDVLMFSSDMLLRESAYLLRKDLLAMQEQTGDTPAIYKKLRTKEFFHRTKQFLKRIQSTHPTYGRADLLDVETSKILISTNAIKEGTTLYDYPDALINRIGPQDPSISMWKLRQTGRATFTVAYPIIELGEEHFTLDILLIIYKNPDTILKPMLHTGGGLGDSGEALLINHNREILAPLKHPLQDGTVAQPLVYKINAEPARRAAGGEEGIISSNDYRGVPVLAAYRYLPISAESGWGMVVKRDKAEIFMAFRQSEFQRILFGIIFILITILITTLLANSLTSSLNKLNRIAQLVEMGNLEVRAEVTGTEETRTLAIALNSMLERYQSWKEELEIIVHKKTGQLKEKNLELEQVVHITSHDLRTPLVNIQGFSSELSGVFKRVDELTNQEKLSDEDRGELDDLLKNDAPKCLSYIQKSTKKIDSLLKGLLKLSRLGRVAVEIRLLDMNILMKEVAASFEFQIREKNVTLIVDNLPPVMGDSVQINQAFSNLIDNALKYLDPERDGTIRISGEQRDDKVVYCVSDNGLGFFEEFTNKIFDIFHRLDPSKSSGDGLGLTIVRKIVERHEGEVWAESKPKAGSSFYISLPLLSESS